MSSKKKQKQKQPPRPPVGILDAVLTAVPPLALFCLRTLVVPCAHEDGSAAPCVTTHHVLTGLAVVITLLGLARLLSADKRTKRSFDLMLALGGVAFAFLPGTVLPLCDDATMVCHTVMLLFARIMGGLVVLLAVLCELSVDHEEPTGRKRRRR